MTDKLTQAKQQLRFIQRTLSNGYVDFDTADELCRAAFMAQRAIEEHEQQMPPVVAGAAVKHITIYEPPHAA